MNEHELLSLLVSLVAAVIALVSLYRTHRLSLRQLQLSEKQAQLAQFQHHLLTQAEEAKRRADVRVRLVKTGSNNYRLVIDNIGPAPAKDVVVDVIVDDGFQSPLIPSEMDKLLPIPQLLANEQLSVTVAVTLSTPSQMVAKVAWADGREGRQTQFCQLSL